MSFSGLPSAICIDGVEYAVYTDFRVWLDINSILKKRMAEPDKLVRLITLCYCDALPPTCAQAIEGIVWFSACGKQNKGHKKSGAPILDFEEDWECIYSAFLHDYKLDLFTAELHWWQFSALFSGLSRENALFKMMEYRSINPAKIKDNERRRFYRRMKELYRLPDTRSDAERERDFAEQLELLQ